MKIILSIIAAILTLAPQQRPPSAIADDLEKLVAELRGIVPPPVPSGTVTNIPCGGAVQAVLTAAKPGDTITLMPGCRYVTGELMLGAKAGVVMLRSAALALPDRRIGPADAALLPILASGNNGKVINGTGAKNWKLDGIQLESTINGAGEIIALQDAQDIVLNRVLIVAGANGQKRAIRGNGQRITLSNSYIANIWAPGQDSQAFCAWDGAGPYALINNYLEAASENVMFGGADNPSADRIPSDILIENNNFSKRPEWRSTGKAVKNLFELKMARRATLRGNTFEYNWREGQDGYAILIKSTNQDGGNTWAVTEDVLVENNVIRNSDNGVNLLGYDWAHPSGRTTRVIFSHNLIQTTGIGFQVGGEFGALTIDRNTIQNGYTLMSLYPGGVWPAGTAAMRDGAYAIENLTFTGNLANHNEYGFKGQSTGIGLSSLTAWVKAWTMTNNVLLGGAGKGSYPPTTWFDLASVPSGVTVGR